MPEDKYSAQKKYLSEKRKNLRVWVDAEKYERFRAALDANGESMYAAINRFIDQYLEETP